MSIRSVTWPSSPASSQRPIMFSFQSHRHLMTGRESCVINWCRQGPHVPHFSTLICLLSCVTKFIDEAHRAVVSFYFSIRLHKFIKFTLKICWLLNPKTTTHSFSLSFRLVNHSLVSIAVKLRTRIMWNRHPSPYFIVLSCRLLFIYLITLWFFSLYWNLYSQTTYLYLYFDVTIWEDVKQICNFNISPVATTINFPPWILFNATTNLI